MIPKTVAVCIMLSLAGCGFTASVVESDQDTIKIQSAYGNPLPMADEHCKAQGKRAVFGTVTNPKPAYFGPNEYVFICE